jgi:hypothetical protein
MVQDQMKLIKLLEEKLRNYNSPLMKYLQPSFKLIGSAAEATRILHGNELDLTVEFEGLTKLESPPFQVLDGDPFFLTATDLVPHWLEDYIGHQNEFLYGQFMADFLEAIDACLCAIFNENMNPESLTRGRTNKEFDSKSLNCQECNGNKEKALTLFKQCKKCAVTVSQTKMGVCLQLFWQSGDGFKIYCSIDLVPTFPIINMKALKLASIVNSAMIQTQPPGWLRYLEKYAMSDVILTDLLDVEARSSEIGSVLLKQLSGEQYFVRPGQNLGKEKFSSDPHHNVYCRIKALKSILKVDLSSYMVKKILLRPAEFMQGSINDFLYSTMCQPELKEKFCKKIDYKKWGKEQYKKNITLLK